MKSRRQELVGEKVVWLSVVRLLDYSHCPLKNVSSIDKYSQSNVVLCVRNKKNKNNITHLQDHQWHQHL